MSATKFIERQKEIEKACSNVAGLKAAQAEYCNSDARLTIGNLMTVFIAGETPELAAIVFSSALKSGHDEELIQHMLLVICYDLNHQMIESDWKDNERFVSWFEKYMYHMVR